MIIDVNPRRVEGEIPEGYNRLWLINKKMDSAKVLEEDAKCDECATVTDLEWDLHLYKSPFTGKVLCWQCVNFDVCEDCVEFGRKDDMRKTGLHSYMCKECDKYYDEYEEKEYQRVKEKELEYAQKRYLRSVVRVNFSLTKALSADALEVYGDASAINSRAKELLLKDMESRKAGEPNGSDE